MTAWRQQRPGITPLVDPQRPFNFSWRLGGFPIPSRLAVATSLATGLLSADIAALGITTGSTRLGRVIVHSHLPVLPARTCPSSFGTALSLAAEPVPGSPCRRPPAPGPGRCGPRPLPRPAERIFPGGCGPAGRGQHRLHQLHRPLNAVHTLPLSRGHRCGQLVVRKEGGYSGI